MKDSMKRPVAWLLMLVMLFSLLPSGLVTAYAEEGSNEIGKEQEMVVSDELGLPDNEFVPLADPEEGPSSDPEPVYHEVVFMYKNTSGVYVTYQESGFTNPQQVLEGQKPALPTGTPAGYGNQVFAAWSDNATQTVYGRTEVLATYNVADTITYTVEFYMQDGTMAEGINTAYVLAYKGAAVNSTVAIPVVEGYDPTEPTGGAVGGFAIAGNTVSINIASASQDLVYRVEYAPKGNIGYKVEHYQQNVNGTYPATPADTDNEQGQTGTIATAVARTYTGFTLETDLTALTGRINANGSTVVKLYYTRNEYALVYNLNGGAFNNSSQATSVSLVYGANISPVTAVSRQGYSFGGWKYNGGTVPGVMPASDVIIDATWTPGTATYKIALWAENADNDAYTLYGTLDMAALTVEGTIPLTSITLPNNPAYTELRTYFTYDATETNKTTYKVAGDGSTVVNAYYSRNTYKVTFTIPSTLTMRVYELADGTITTLEPSSGTYDTLVYESDTSPKYEINPKYNQSIITMWPTASNFTGDGNTTNFTGWLPTGSSSTWASMRVTMTSDMCDASGVTVTAQGGTVNLQYLHYRIESIENSAGAGRVEYTYGGTTRFYENDPEISQYLYNNSGSWSAKSLTGLTPVNDSGVLLDKEEDPLYVHFAEDGKTPVSSNTAFYYVRDSYSIILNNGSDTAVTKGPVKYGFDITSYNETPSEPGNLAGMGYTFDGWFTNQGYEESARYVWTNGMPPNNLVLYAKWVAPTFTVAFNVGSGSPTPATQTIVKGGTVTEPTGASAPTYFKHVITGWFTDAAFTQRFLFNQEIHQDLTLYARWEGDTSVDVTVKYQDMSGGTLAPDDNYVGQLNNDITVTAKIIDGYMPSKRTITESLTEITGHTIIFQYDTKQEVNYTVYYRDASDNSDLLDPKTLASSGRVYVTEHRLVIPGYTADAYSKTLILILSPGENSITFYYTKNPINTNYTVTIYKENLNSDGFTAETPVTIPATTGETVTMAASAYPGFEYNATLSQASGIVLDNNGLKLELYYTRTRHQYLVEYVDLQGSGATTNIATATRQLIKYGKSISESALTFSGYAYAGYEIVNGASGTGNTASATITDNTTVIRFKYNRQYTITASVVNGMISSATTATVTHGGNATFTYAANTYYIMDQVLVDGVAIASPNDTTYTFSNVTASHTLEIKFKKNTYYPTITAQQQTYTYNAAAQGHFGANLNTDGDTTYVVATGLLPGHRLVQATLSGSQQTNADTYTGAITPSAAKIVDASGEDMNDFYSFTNAYVKGNLVINKKGDGSNPITVKATDQTYMYTGGPQGTTGTNMDATSVATATALLGGHKLATVTITGAQETNVGTYANRLVPTAAKIVDADNNDVTINYNITAASYVPGTLKIVKLGSAEFPVVITASKQEYVYDGSAQGTVGAQTIAAGATDPVATASGLLFGHRLAGVAIGGAKQTEPNTYTGHLVPSAAKIVDASGTDVTDNYDLTLPGTYVAGDLIIHKKGNGDPDPAGGEKPLDVTAVDQSYIYNDAPQGKVGNNLVATGLATAIGLLPGHSLQTVSLSGLQKTYPGIYTDELLPTAVKIVDGGGNDMTSKYRIESTGFHAGDLIIYKKGSGEVDPAGGEKPLKVTAKDQTFIYNDQLRGDIGTKTGATATATVATTLTLVPGHRLEEVTISGAQEKLPGTYTDRLVPSGAKIYNTANQDVTEHYRIDGTSYIAGALIITKKGGTTDNTKPIAVSAADQTFVYNGAAQGTVGTGLEVTAANPLASSPDLITGHRIERITLAGDKKTDVGAWPNHIVPSAVVIRNASNEDVTPYYLTDNSTTYKNGQLSITKKGSGENNQDPLKVTASNQSFVYNGVAQGTYGASLEVGTVDPLATAVGLVGGHSLKYITLTGAQRTEVGTSTNVIAPSAVIIHDGSGNNVTSNYNLEGNAYFTGNLTITPKGADGSVTITASNQSYVYSAAPQGNVGTGLTVGAVNPVATASGLVSGHRLVFVDIDVAKKTEPGTYTGYLTPTKAVIYDDGNNDVSTNYSIPAASYIAGNLFIDKKGGGVDNSQPITITAQEQNFIYNAQPQGEYGVKTVSDTAIWAIASDLITGHKLVLITLSGSQATNPGTYGSAITPSVAKIEDASGNDVTSFYKIETSSYVKGDLKIVELSSLNIKITARKQEYIYDGSAKGQIGAQTINPTDPNALASASGLLTGHRLVEVTFAQAQQTDPSTYTDYLIPSAAKILDGNNADVSSFYGLVDYGMPDANYVPADLIIHKKGSGDPDPAGGEKPLVITTQPQEYIYNGGPQGNVGTGINATGVVVATGLLPGHSVATVDMNVGQKTDADVYTNHLAPTAVKIVNAANQDVTDKYRIEAGSFIPADLTIYKKGSGNPDPDGGETPMTITATKQEYIFNDGLQGAFGANLAISATDPLATAVELVSGHRLESVTLTGNQQKDPATYTNAITPSAAKIVDAGGGDVTKNYEIDLTSYIKGDLVIYKKGNGDPDPAGGEKPIQIQAQDQDYVYNDAPQGVVGNGISATNVAQVVSGLLPGHKLMYITLNVAQQTYPSVYTNYLTPTVAVIVDAGNVVVTHKYEIDDATSYLPGTLTIYKKGNGTQEPDGSEQPLEIEAIPQTYVYDGTAKGNVGTKTGAAATGQVVTTLELITGHTLQNITIGGGQKIIPDTYTNHLVPSGAKIVNSKGADVTAHYLIEAGSYISANLVIEKRGSGIDNDKPITITAANQTYEYNGALQGTMGSNVQVTTANPWVSSPHLAAGHYIDRIDLAGTQQKNVGFWGGYLVPSNVVIRDASNQNVTPYYQIDSTSYIAGDLEITKKGTGGDKLKITAQNQTYVYNDAPQGDVGLGLAITATDPVAVATGLLTGHKLAFVDIDVAKQTLPATYTNYLVPSNAVIYDESNVDVTSNYTIDAETYVAGTLLINKKGSGETDGNGGEKPFIVQANDQEYIYNDALQGIVGNGIAITALDPVATPTGLVPGHVLKTVDLSGTQKKDAGVYTDELKPVGVRIEDAFGNNVTANYLIVAKDSYLPGTLTIAKKGAGANNDQPITISAVHQNYIYNAQPQGEVGKNLTWNALTPVAEAGVGELLTGHAIKTVSIDVAQKTEAGTYTNHLVPSNVKIVNGSSVDVTKNYYIDTTSYVPANLVIQAYDTPITLHARNQVYVYNDQPQGIVGTVTLKATTANAVVTAPDLLFGHYLAQVDLAGSQETYPGTYAGTLIPSNAVVKDAKGNDVTANYTFDPAGDTIGDLIINKKGDGTDNGSGGENPMKIQARNQEYVYNETPQGVVGAGLAPTTALPLITTKQLVPGHKVQYIDIGGSQQQEPGVYTDTLVPANIVIINASNVDVTAHYEIDGTSYIPGTLTIHKKGNGKPDPNGGEQPLEIKTPDQTYVYDATPHGVVGNNLTVTTANKLASAVELLPGHYIDLISIKGSQRTEAGTYKNALVPADIVIRNASNVDVTDKYRIESKSYIPATLTIRPRGTGGNPDRPLTVTVGDETYTYNGALQGSYGVVQINGVADPIATLVDILPIHTFETVTLVDGREANAGTYRNALKPIGVKIVDAAGKDVTANYLLTSASYKAGTLTINKLGRGIGPAGTELPIMVVAETQEYEYNGRPRGIIGTLLKNDPSNPVATAIGILPGHKILRVDISGKRQVEVGEYEYNFMPSNVHIYDAFGVEVTNNYLIGDGTYWPGHLIITEPEEGVLGVVDGSLIYYDYTGATQRDVGDVIE